MDTMGYLFIILALTLDIVCRISGQIYLTTDVNPIQGTPFTFVCSTTTLSKTVTFFDPQGWIAGSCLFPEYNCDSGYDYKLSQNISALRTFLTIENLNRSLHQGNWKCIYGQERAQMNLSVMTLPDRVNLEGLQNDVNLSATLPGIINVTCSCSCSYPDAMFGLSLVVGTSEYPLQSYIYKKHNIDTKYACIDQLENAFTSQFSVNIGSELLQLTSKTARLKCYVTVSAVRVPVFGMSVGRIIYPDSSTTPPQDTKTAPQTDTSTTPPPSAQLQNENETNVGAIVGGVIGGLIFAVLIVVVVCVLRCRRYEKHPNSQTRANPHELTTVGTHYGNPYQSAPWNIEPSQPDSKSLVPSFGPRNNLYQLAQNIPEGITCAFIRERVTEDAGRRITDHNVFEFRR